MCCKAWAFSFGFEPAMWAVLGWKSYGPCSCGAETQSAWGFQASSLGSTLSAKLQAVLLSGPPFWLFSFLAPYQSYEKKGWEALLTLGSWHSNPSVVFLKNVAFLIFSLWWENLKFRLLVSEHLHISVSSLPFTYNKISLTFHKLWLLLFSSSSFLLFCLLFLNCFASIKHPFTTHQ